MADEHSSRKRKIGEAAFLGGVPRNRSLNRGRYRPL